MKISQLYIESFFYIFFFVFFLSTATFGQEAVNPTYSFFISGKVKKNVKINMDSLNQYPFQEFVNPKITNYSLDFMHAKSVKGVLLKTILSRIAFNLNNFKQLRDASFLFIGSNGMIGFSWDEVFNSEIGNHLFIIMEVDGVKAAQIPENIQMTSMINYKSGRRYLRNLEQIRVMQLNQK